MLAKAQQERRRFLRVPVNLKGRLFLPDDGRETDCTIIDMSPGSAQVESPVLPEPQAPVVLYIEGFGRFDAVVARPIKGEWSDGKFGVKFNCSPLKRERVAEQLAHFVERGTLDDTALRRHERVPTRGLTRFTRASGEVVNCEVLDLSLGGVSLATNVRPQIGEVVLIGQIAGRVVRIHENGIGIEFMTPPQEKSAPESPPLAAPLP